RLTLAPAGWSPEGDDVLLQLPPSVGRGPSAASPCALVVERHHPYRATRMVGACLRGHLAEESVGGLRLAVEQVTWWRGFKVRTQAVRRGALGAEGVITERAQVLHAGLSAEAEEPVSSPRAGEGQGEGALVAADLVEANEVDVHLAPGAGRLPERSFLSSSACGVCGATTV